MNNLQHKCVIFASEPLKTKQLLDLLKDIKLWNSLTNEKLTIVGAAGMIGSNMAQTALMMKLTPNICLYDPFAPALEGVAEELYHCAVSRG